MAFLLYATKVYNYLPRSRFHAEQGAAMLAGRSARHAAPKFQRLFSALPAARQGDCGWVELFGKLLQGVDENRVPGPCAMRRWRGTCRGIARDFGLGPEVSFCRTCRDQG